MSNYRNRTLERVTVTLVRVSKNDSLYYANSDRLKTNGKYAFKHDDAGNLTDKGNKFNISGNDVTFTETSGEGVEYWHYTYDLLNRLTEVQNSTLISEYGYDPEGLRVVKKARGETIHYVFEEMEPIFERKMNSSNHAQVIYTKSYVYALEKHLARVDGEMDTYDNLQTRGVPVYFYTTDHLGSVKVVTDRNGTTVFQADHTPFGERFVETIVDSGFDEWHSFTGKEFDPDTGQYYFNARWYDADTGRFISEDPAMDPNNPNLYSYARNNPLTVTDPTGLISQEDAMKLHELIKTDQSPVEKLSQMADLNIDLDFRVSYAERNIPGFKYDPNLKRFDYVLSIESQISLFYYMQEKAKELSGKDYNFLEVLINGTLEQQIAKAREEAISAILWLNIQTGTYNLFHEKKRGYYYSNEDIVSALVDIQFVAFVQMYFAHEGARISTYMGGTGTRTSGKTGSRTSNSTGNYLAGKAPSQLHPE